MGTHGGMLMVLTQNQAAQSRSLRLSDLFFHLGTSGQGGGNQKTMSV
jgi:hypothetical protein